MQNKRIKWIRMISMVMILALWKPILTQAAVRVPSTVRVGLRSAYSKQSSIEIKNQELQVGYQVDDYFRSEATLTSNIGFLMRPSQKQYYTTGDSFSTYHDAAFVLLDYKVKGVAGLVVYSGPGHWRIYLEEDLGGLGFVRSKGDEILVQNSVGIDFILCENNGVPPAFAGVSPNHPFFLTQLSKATYRGWFEMIRQGNTITAANIVDFEDYLYGVVPSEMPASWPSEALKAQAVAARSMAIHQYNKYIKDGYNICDTTFTQVYKGFSGERTSTNQAVDETRGLVATYHGKIAETLYSSTSGGYTEDPKHVWGSSIAYLKSIPDPYETDPEMKPWTRLITLSDLDLAMAKNNIHIGKATGMRINEYTPAGRVNDLEILGTSGSHSFTREKIRTFLSGIGEGSLRSRMFTMENGRAESRPSASNNAFDTIHVYQGGQAQYILGRYGKVTPVGAALTVQGPASQATYGEGGASNNGALAHSQYGDILISGKGFGHGVGMSQSGAKGMAKAGYTFDEIIKYYFQGVELEK